MVLSSSFISCFLVLFVANSSSSLGVCCCVLFCPLVSSEMSFQCSNSVLILFKSCTNLLSSCFPVVAYFCCYCCNYLLCSIRLVMAVIDESLFVYFYFYLNIDSQINQWINLIGWIGLIELNVNSNQMLWIYRCKPFSIITMKV